MFGSIFQASRKTEGLSQSELARRAKTYQANISDFENEKRAFRTFLQINDELFNSKPEELGTICLSAPSIRDRNYLALLSGLVQYHFKRNLLPLPAWINLKEQRLSSPWFVDKTSRLEDFIRSNTPKEFSNLNVFLSQEELQSV